MRRLSFVAILLVCSWAPPVRTAPETGAVSGIVRLTSKIRGNPLPTAAYTPRAVDRHQPPATPEIRNVIVYLKSVDYDGPLQATAREIVQEHEAFVPRALAVTRGSTVSFPNEDPIFHNVFSLSGAGAFDLGRYPRGQTRGRVFAKTGLVKVFCHIHSQMSASILVLDHPFFTAPRDDGAFEIPRVPEGRYTVVGWHERVGERTATIDVVAGQRASVALSLPVE